MQFGIVWSFITIYRLELQYTEQILCSTLYILYFLVISFKKMWMEMNMVMCAIMTWIMIKRSTIETTVPRNQLMSTDYSWLCMSLPLQIKKNKIQAENTFQLLIINKNHLVCSVFCLMKKKQLTELNIWVIV